jgi:MFS transporter, DHA2 family, multidrug resistance protein
MSPAGFFALVAMPFVGRALGRGLDTRWLIGAGLLVMTAGNYWMSQMNLDISPGQVVWPRVMLIVGLSICFAPISTLHRCCVVRPSGCSVCCVTRVAA